VVPQGQIPYVSQESEQVGVRPTPVAGWNQPCGQVRVAHRSKLIRDSCRAHPPHARQIFPGYRALALQRGDTPQFRLNTREVVRFQKIQFARHL
jgi:hypothetical protein